MTMIIVQRATGQSSSLDLTHYTYTQKYIISTYFRLHLHLSLT